MFDEGWQFLVVLLSCVWGVWIALTICVWFILLSKLVFGYEVLCENCECIDGKELGNVWRDKYLFVGMCRSWVVLIVLYLFCRKGGDKLFLGKALYLLLVFFESMTDFVFILLELVSNWWSVAFCKVEVGIDEFISLDRKCVGR